ncbi:hypothetical protein tloyanaT_08490 [Thalassotalea loyana]|uniref:GtrA/DPMS transmembrane domain-containing protein n=1 Tax=Thalassotalea loyana TaxID=280483 RepID=A0ABQ6H8Z5_9GAMM|nr:GtrA family protein [Thalassotalea loyana]GLX84597.1 hypothetical protein tloyanaT_08490 [Thalassotalea loyana]
MKEIYRFAIVGGGGFIVDALCFYGISLYFDMNIVVVRTLAFCVAMIVTWLGNRYFTFHASSRVNALRQFMKHALTASSSFLLNLIGFMVVLKATNLVSVAFIVGVSIAFVSNYAVSKSKVFV